MIESAARFDPTKLYVIAEETVIMHSGQVSTAPSEDAGRRETGLVS
jgi:hypothetical protein